MIVSRRATYSKRVLQSPIVSYNFQREVVSNPKESSCLQDRPTVPCRESYGLQEREREKYTVSTICLLNVYHVSTTSLPHTYYMSTTCLSMSIICLISFLKHVYHMSNICLPPCQPYVYHMVTTFIMHLYCMSNTYCDILVIHT